MALEIGVIGLGRMATEIAANLVSAEGQVITYIRRSGRVGELSSRDIRPTTKLEKLAHRDPVISMRPDENAVRDVVCGPDGLASQLKRRAIHIAMNTISADSFGGRPRAHLEGVHNSTEKVQDDIP